MFTKEYWINFYTDMKDLFSNYTFQQFLGTLMLLNMVFPLGTIAGLKDYHSLVIFALGCMGIIVMLTDYYTEGGSRSLNKLKV